MIDPTPDSEIPLSFENQRAVVSPWGGALRRYYLMEADGGETDVIWGYSGGSQKKGGQGDVLIPFPGRVAEGRYSFEGQTLQLERNDKEGPNAIHGFVRALPWKIREVQPGRVAFDISLDAETYGHRGYPFSLAISVTYGLDHRGLSCSFALQNAGRQAAPVGVGFHPYFTVGTRLIDEAEAKIPCAKYLEFNERLAPTGIICDAAGTEWDYRDYRRIGSRRFNHCYVDLERDEEGMAIASLRQGVHGRAIDIVMDRSFSALVVYTGDAIAAAPRRALAIEPMTCATDALNHPEWGLKRLLPDESFTGRYLVRSGRK
ncbi:MAG: putative Aldose 1-epimerase [Nitrospira sp.]|jgi:aldose 1-epimerase|nr:putative Aldose 1-epimerase [Nitrospira sp.]